MNSSKNSSSSLNWCSDNDLHSGHDSTCVLIQKKRNRLLNGTVFLFSKVLPPRDQVSKGLKNKVEAYFQLSPFRPEWDAGA